MNKAIIEKLDELVSEGSEAEFFQRELWAIKVRAFLDSALGSDETLRFEKLKTPAPDLTHALRIGHLQGLLARGESETSDVRVDPGSTSADVSSPPSLRTDSRKVFVVHGHDNEAKESAARFLGKLGLEPIILHEQPSSGRTVIEKFETYSDDVAFAVVLLTPDDVGSTANDTSNLKKRARQNVIMELGYFMGRLGRTRVCALHKGGVELPSDYQGVLYIELDSAGAWKGKLAQEFVQAKMSIDLTGLLGS